MLIPACHVVRLPSLAIEKYQQKLEAKQSMQLHFPVEPLYALPHTGSPECRQENFKLTAHWNDQARTARSSRFNLGDVCAIDAYGKTYKLRIQNIAVRKIQDTTVAADIWQRIHGTDSWNRNNWVWVVTLSPGTGPEVL